MPSLGQNSFSQREPKKKADRPQSTTTSQPTLGQLQPGPVSPRPRSKRQPARQAIAVGRRMEVLKRDDFRCYLCGATPKQDSQVRLEVDHRIPVSLGGTNELANLQTLCQPCNQGKSNHLI